jgi:hypothetical protein
MDHNNPKEVAAQRCCGKPTEPFQFALPSVFVVT